MCMRVCVDKHKCVSVHVVSMFVYVYVCVVSVCMFAVLTLQ